MSRRKRIVIIGVVVLVALVLLVGALAQRSKPDLDLWHTAELDGEFEAGQASEGFGWTEYVAGENALFAELEAEVVEPSREVANPDWSRFAGGGVNDPETFPRNWNRSFELEADPPRGGALLIHGLTDSPYSLRAVGEILNAHGVHVVGLRLPGHGTAPTALRHARVADWRAAVRIAATHLASVVGDRGELIVVGYSNGGALALDLALEALQDDSLPALDRIILFSPAIGVTRVAGLARSHHLLTFMPWFDKLEWTDIWPEYDPFKYNSFPKDAAYQTHVLTRSVRQRMARLGRGTATRGFPPVLTFMSLADATVLVEAVVDGLYDHLSGDDHELVVFDINRHAGMRGFFRTDPVVRLQTLVDRPTTDFRLTVLNNVSDASDAVVVRTRAAGAKAFDSTDPGLAWPPGVYSLSHVALTFPPDDPIYGSRPPEEGAFGLQIGAFEPRGERGLLIVPASQLTRLRSNPFFPYVEQRLVELVGGVPEEVSPATSAP
jgi:alpha-beta hydrolase superfamily lysophospholipase